MIEKDFEWNIDGMQANAVLENMEIKVPINRNNYKNIFIGKNLNKEIDTNEFFLKIALNYKGTSLDKDILDQIHLSYMIKDNKYYIGFDYNEVFNNILDKLHMGKHLKTKEFNSQEDFDKLIKEIKKEIAFYDEIKSYDNSHNPEVEKRIESIYNHLQAIIACMKQIEKIIDYYTKAQIEEEKEFRNNKKPLCEIKNKNISWKNLMFYSSIKALNTFNKTGDLKYYRYAKNYYNHVSKNRIVEYPKGLTVDNVFYDSQYTEFNKRFLLSQKAHFSELDVRLGIEDKEKLLEADTLIKGDKEIGLNNNSKSKKKIDFSKINAKLQRKITFYRGLTGKIQGTIEKKIRSDEDYIGFVLDNNYIIFDKFYKTTKDGKASPAYDDAIYVVTIDVAEMCGYDKGKIRKYIKKNKDYKAFRFYHKDDDSYQEKILKIMDYSDISFIKFKELKLKNENKKNN